MSDAEIVDFRRGPVPRKERTQGRDWSNTDEQRLALTVPCRYCGAAQGALCITDAGAVLTRFPAHPRRTNDAKEKAARENHA